MTEVALANSPKAQQFIQERLDALERKPVSLTYLPSDALHMRLFAARAE